MSVSVVGRRPQVPMRFTTGRVVLALVVSVNLAMYVLYQYVIRPRRQAKAQAVAASVRPISQPLPTRLAPAESAKSSAADSALARAHRVAGLAALEGGEYGLAVKEFSAALKLGEGSADSTELLRIAKELQDRSSAREAQARSTEKEARLAEERSREKEREVERQRAATKAANAKRRSAPVAVAKATPKPEAAAAGTGLLLVTSNPSGLVVELDGRRVDFTPARIKAEAGFHSITLWQGETKLYERRLEVMSDGVHSIDPDLAEKLRPAQREEPRPLEPNEEALAKAVAKSPPELVAPASPREAAAERTAILPFGELHVLSTSVYGDVWINGENYGRAPLVARNIPSGPATVEIRVDGSVRRSKVVEVAPSRPTTLKMR